MSFNGRWRRLALVQTLKSCKKIVLCSVLFYNLLVNRYYLFILPKRGSSLFIDP
nr:MAG TPA: hypothetical protein [Bacteriophage sp.]